MRKIFIFAITLSPGVVCNGPDKFYKRGSQEKLDERHRCSVMECVGMAKSMMHAISSTRPGGHIGYVGVPHNVELSGEKFFYVVLNQKLSGDQLIEVIQQ